MIGGKVKRSLRDVYWTWYGPRLRNPGLPFTIGSVLFVCQGNICRSPFAEHLASKIWGERNVRGVSFQSAGLRVPKPHASPEEAIQIAKQFGVNLEGHASKPISREMVDTSDMVIAMEAWQYHALSASFERYHKKLFLLPLFDVDASVKRRGYSAFNIEDPYGGSPDRFTVCFERIERCLGQLFSLIKR